MEAKKVSNYELFFDLVFVLGTNALVGILHSSSEQTIHFGGVLTFIVSTLSLWSLWIVENSYLNRYSRRDINDIYTIIAAALLIGNMVTLFTANWRSGFVNFNGISIPIYWYYNLLFCLALGVILLQYKLHIRSYGNCSHDMKLAMKNILQLMGIVLTTTFVVSIVPEE